MNRLRIAVGSELTSTFHRYLHNLGTILRRLTLGLPRAYPLYRIWILPVRTTDAHQRYNDARKVH